MERLEAEIEMVLRHIRVGEEILARQRRVILRLSNRGLPTATSEKLLQQFEEAQAAHRAHFDRL
jgi:predicted transcriptional regulator